PAVRRGTKNAGGGARTREAGARVQSGPNNAWILESRTGFVTISRVLLPNCCARTSTLSTCTMGGTGKSGDGAVMHAVAITATAVTRRTARRLTTPPSDGS